MYTIHLLIYGYCDLNSQRSPSQPGKQLKHKQEIIFQLLSVVFLGTTFASSMVRKFNLTVACTNRLPAEDFPQ